MNEPKTTLTDGSPVTPDHTEIDPATGLQKGYEVLSESERAKGFAQPVRHSYVHVGIRPKHRIRDLTSEEKSEYPDAVAFEEYPESERPVTGRYWSKEDLESGCKLSTKIDGKIAETYARSPKFYGATYCAICRDHFPLKEFVWEGTDIRVGDGLPVADEVESEVVNCDYCGATLSVYQHHCVAGQVLEILNREVPYGNAAYMSGKHKVELAKAIYNEIFVWKKTYIDGVMNAPSEDDGEHLFLLKTNSGETTVLYGEYSDLRLEFGLSGHGINEYMVIN